MTSLIISITGGYRMRQTVHTGGGSSSPQFLPALPGPMACPGPPKGPTGSNLAPGGAPRGGKKPSPPHGPLAPCPPVPGMRNGSFPSLSRLKSGCPGPTSIPSPPAPGSRPTAPPSGSRSDRPISSGFWPGPAIGKRGYAPILPCSRASLSSGSAKGTPAGRWGRPALPSAAGALAAFPAPAEVLEVVSS